MRSKSILTVGIVDDNRVRSCMIATMIDQQPGMRGVASTADDMQKVVDADPAVLLLAAAHRDEEPLDVVAAMKDAMPYAKIVIIDFVAPPSGITEFVTAGVAAFLLQDADFDELITTIRAVAQGETVLPTPLTASFFSEIASRSRGLRSKPNRDATREQARMTAREQDIVELIGAGLNTREIAARLNIATHTVRTHVGSVLKKLELHTRLQIAAYAAARGMTDTTHLA
jgi:two-component system, NarL family, nitrate/nitrite response regulator NarL